MSGLGIAVSCPGLLWVSSRLLAVWCPVSLCCWLASSWCLLWRIGWRWCLCFPCDVFFCSSSNMWACSLETTLWRHLYLPWLRVTLHEYSIWSRVPHFHKYYILGCLCGTFGIYWLLNITVVLVICACLMCSLSLEHSKVFQSVLYIWLMNALSSWWLNYRVSWFWGIYKWAMLFFWYLKGFI